MKKISIITFLITILVLGACAEPTSTVEEDVTEVIPPIIYVTLFPQYELVRTLAKDAVDLRMLIPAGVEPHAFEPSPSMILNLSTADLMIYTNELMEPWIERVKVSLGSDGLRFMNVSEGIGFIEHFEPEEVGHHHHHDHDDELDPHVWLEPNNFRIMAQNVLNALLDMDFTDEQKESFRTNFISLEQDIRNLEAAFDDAIVGAKHNVVIYGGHFAFGYLAERYNLRILSPYPGFSPDAEPSPRAITSLINTMQRYGITTVFYEELVNPRSADIIAAQTGARTELLHGAHNLTQAEWDARLTYFQIMLDNAAKLKQALNNE
jgi:zinc transport system substrate-binding protein